MIPTLWLHDVRKPGRAAGSMLVQVYRNDAQLAIRIHSAVLGALQGKPYLLKVHTVDHTGTAKSTPHDTILSPLQIPSLGKSVLSPGLYSLEIKCRSIGEPMKFDWEGVLTQEAEPLWNKCRGTGDWAGRILVLVRLSSPCHADNGEFSTHAAILKTERGAKWERLWGWSGFRRPGATAPPPPPSPGRLPAAPVPQPSNVGARAAGGGDALEKLWKKHFATLEHNGWIQLSKFLEKVKLPSGQSTRYVNGKTSRTWKVRGKPPVLKKDWDYIKGGHGGGQGKGLPHVKVSFLKAVFQEYGYQSKVGA